MFNTIRPRQDLDAVELTRREVGGGLSLGLAFVGRVTAISSLPASTEHYYAVHPVSVLGPEVEGGGDVAVADTSRVIYVCVIGSQGPAIGDDLVCRSVNHRWVAERGGPAPVVNIGVIPGCACTQIPATLHLSSTGPCGDGTFPSCTFHFGPTPLEFAGLDLGSRCFLSAETFLDSYSGASYRFHLGCDTIFFRLSRVYLASDQGDAFHDATIYAWSIGQPGNTCHPFLLSTGYIYSGGDPHCIVMVTE